MSELKLRGSYKWPKVLPPLSEEQQVISDDFMRFWHERLEETSAFVPLQNFNHGYSVQHAPKQFTRTLEIGAGLGEHLEYEKLTDEQRKNYFALDLRQNMVDQLQSRYPDVQACVGDCQTKLDFEDDSFDRVLAIHVLEHLPNLPAAVAEIYRVLDKKKGTFSIVIPCEGGLVYAFCRLISSQRLFQQRYKQPFTWFIEREHLSIPAEITDVLYKYFEPAHTEYFPFKAPIVNMNVCIGLTLRPKRPELVPHPVASLEKAKI